MHKPLWPYLAAFCGGFILGGVSVTASDLLHHDDHSTDELVASAVPVSSAEYLQVSRPTTTSVPVRSNTR